MQYQPILDTEIAQGQPITSSLITRLRNNPLALISAVPDEITATGNYNVASGVTLLMVICVGGGGGGGCLPGAFGGSSGFVKCGFITTTGSGSEQLPCVIGSGGGGASSLYSSGGGGGPTTFNNTITAAGGIGGVEGQFLLGETQPAFSQNGAVNYQGKQTMMTGGAPGSGGVGGGGAAGVPIFLRTSSLGNGGDRSSISQNGQNATGYGAGGGGGGLANNQVRTGGNGSGGIIFVLPLQG
jgi:hypothetical protein